MRGGSRGGGGGGRGGRRGGRSLLSSQRAAAEMSYTDSAEEGEVVPNSATNHNDDGGGGGGEAYSSYASMAAAAAAAATVAPRGRGSSSGGGGRYGGGSSYTNTNNNNNNNFNSTRGGRSRGGGRIRGGGGRYHYHASSRYNNADNNDDANSLASAEDNTTTSSSFNHRGGGRGRGRGGGERGGRRGRGGRSYMSNSGGRGRGSGSSSYRGSNDWNTSHETGSVSSYEARGGNRGRGGRSTFGRAGRGRGGRYDSSLPSSSFPYGKRRRDDMDDNRTYENMEQGSSIKRLRDTAPSFGSEGEIDEDGVVAGESHERRSSASPPGQQQSRSFSDHPGLDRPLSEGRRGSWDDRSASQEGSSSGGGGGGRHPQTSPPSIEQKNRTAPMESQRLFDGQQEQQQYEYDYHSRRYSPDQSGEMPILPSRDEDASQTSRRESYSSYGTSHWGATTTPKQNDSYGSADRRDSYPSDSQEKIPAASNDHHHSSNQDRRDSMRSDSQSVSTNRTPLDVPLSSERSCGARRGSYQALGDDDTMGPPNKMHSSSHQQDSGRSYADDLKPNEDYEPTTSATDDRRYDGMSNGGSYDQYDREERQTGVSAPETGGIFRTSSNERPFSSIHYSHPSPRGDERYSSMGRPDWKDTGRSRSSIDSGNMSPRDASRRGAFRRSMEMREDRRNLNARDFGASASNRYSSNDTPPRVAQLDNKILQTGYASLANLPGPMKSPRTTQTVVPTQQEAAPAPPSPPPPPPPPPLTSGVHSAEGEATAGTLKSVVGGHNSEPGSLPASGRPGNLRIDVGRSQPVSDHRDTSASFYKAPPSFSPRPGPSPRETYGNRPPSPSPRGEFGRRSGFDGAPGAQNWGGRGRGRGRGFGRGGEFSPMGGRGPPRSFDSAIQGGRGGRVGSYGDMAAIPDRVARGSNPNLESDFQGPIRPGQLEAGNVSGGVGTGPIESRGLNDNRHELGGSSPMDGIVSENRPGRGTVGSLSPIPDGSRPFDSMMSDDAAMHMSGPYEGAGLSSFDSFRGGRGRGPFGRLGGRGRHRDFGRGGRGRGGRGWDQGGRMQRPWEQRAPQSMPNMAIPPPPPPAQTPLLNSFGMLADANPNEMYRRHPSNEGHKPPLPPPPMSQSSPLPQSSTNAAGTTVVDVDAKPPSPPPPEPGPALPPPTEPSGLVLALTRLADMEEELNFAYVRHMRLMAKQKKLRAEYARLEELPVGLEAFEDNLKAHIAQTSTARHAEESISTSAAQQ